MLEGLVQGNRIMYGKLQQNQMTPSLVDDSNNKREKKVCENAWLVNDGRAKQMWGDTAGKTSEKDLIVSQINGQSSMIKLTDEAIFILSPSQSSYSREKC